MNFVDIVFASLLANNFLFFQFLGLAEYLGEDHAPSLARRTGALALLLLLGVLLFWVPDHFLLQAFHLEFLRTLLVLAVLAVLTLGYTALIKTAGGPWPQPREILVHSLLVGGVVVVGGASPDLAEVLTAALAVALGYGGALFLLRGVTRRLARERIPPFIQGLPLQLVTLGLVWLALHGLGFAFVGKVS